MAKISELELVPDAQVDGDEMVPVVKDGDMRRAYLRALLAPYLSSVAPLLSSFIVEPIPGETDLEQTVDEYGCVQDFVSAEGVTNLFALATETVTAGVATARIVNTGIIAAQLLDSDEYAETIEDEYGCIAGGILRDGSWDFGDAAAFATPAALASLGETQADGLDRLHARPDGVMRRADWTYVPVYGESTSVGASGYPAISVTQPYANLTFTGGTKAGVGAGSTDGVKPLVEDNKAAGGGADTTTQGETPASGMANTLVEYVASRYGVSPAKMVIFSSTPGQGGRTVLELSKGAYAAGQSGFDFFGRFMGHISAAKALADAQGKSLIVPCWHFVCGANDASVPTSYANMLARLTALAVDADAAIRAITGQTVPAMMLLYQTSAAFSGATLEPIQLAQFDAAAQSPLIELTSPWYDQPYSGDNVHALNVSYRLFGRRMGIHAARYIFEGTGRPLTCTSAIARGTTVRLRFSEQVTIDTASLGAATQNGIRIADSAGNVPITSMVIDKGDLVLTLANAPVGAWSARVALDYRGSGSNVGAGTTGHSSNIRATLAHSYYAAGARQSLYRWAPHQQVAGFTLETA